MNTMVFQLQPESSSTTALDAGFRHPGAAISAESRAWESCMTMNDSWGYQRADDDWKTPKTIVRNLIAARTTPAIIC